jgi:hypothetical protein
MRFEDKSDVKVFCVRDVRKALARRVKVLSAETKMNMGEIVNAGIILVVPVAQADPKEFSTAFLEAAASLGVADPHAFMLDCARAMLAGEEE